MANVDLLGVCADAGLLLEHVRHRGHRQVADLGRAKSAMLMARMGERYAELCLPLRDHACCRRSRSVIGNNNLESAVALP